MKTNSLFLAAFLTMGLSSVAFAQTTTPGTTIPPGTTTMPNGTGTTTPGTTPMPNNTGTMGTGTMDTRRGTMGTDNGTMMQGDRTTDNMNPNTRTTRGRNKMSNGKTKSRTKPMN